MKNILLLGSTGGIGSGILAKLCNNENYQIIVVGRNPEKILELKKNNPNIISYCADLSDSKQVEIVFEEITKKFNIDILVNAAGLSMHGKFEKFSINDIDNLITSNYSVLVYTCHKIWSSFIERKQGIIINISSLSGNRGYENGTIYCSIKAAINMFLQTLAIEGQTYGIKVTNILPGNVYTPVWNLDNEEVKKGVKNMLQTGDIGDIVNFIIELPENVFIEELKVKPTIPMVKFSGVHSKRFIL